MKPARFRMKGTSELRLGAPSGERFLGVGALAPAFEVEGLGTLADTLVAAG